jgi:hypothetical protein
MKILFRTLTSLLLAAILVLVTAVPAWAFCGFYVAGANTKLFNEASQVIIAHQDDKTVLTMANDFQGAVKDFALVVPVPVAIKREQVNVGDISILKKLDTFSQPRLVEYNDPDPCNTTAEDGAAESSGPQRRRVPRALAKPTAGGSGVTIEDSFKVNEYEILILSAKESDGLESWLRGNGYRVPKGSAAVLKPYIRQNMKFFVAKVDLKEFDKSGQKFLRPLQIAYQSPKFMLPIRLGMLNAKGDQDLVAYILSPKGQVEVANYRTVKVPTGNLVPEFVKDDFGKFYQATFQRSYEQENKKVAFLEYAWDVSNCDPCSTEPPTAAELRSAGVFWSNGTGSKPQPPSRGRPPRPRPSNTFITRLHVRYSRAKFAEDLVFQETSNRENFQGRYVMTHPFRGAANCPAAENYRRTVADRQQQEAQNLSNLTGWKLSDVQKRIQPLAATKPEEEKFWPW